MSPKRKREEASRVPSRRSAGCRYLVPAVAWSVAALTPERCKIREKDFLPAERGAKRLFERASAVWNSDLILRRRAKCACANAIKAHF
jgi:hypothetical protein